MGRTDPSGSGETGREQKTGAHSSSGLSLYPEERREVRRRTTVRAQVVHEAIRAEGEEELGRAPQALAWSGLAAGLSMGFSMTTEGLLRAGLPQTAWATVVANIGYSVGFLIVVLGRQQLFTENTLTVILPLLHNRNRDTLRLVVRLWAIVLVANVLGAFLFALAAAYTGAFPHEVKEAFTEVGRTTIAGGFGATFVRAVFAGWLIALMVWLLPAAESARFWIIVVTTSLVALGNFVHVIAGSVETSYLLVTGDTSLATFFVDFLLPAFFGNVVGGVALVSALNHAQVVSGEGIGGRSDEQAEHAMPDRERDSRPPGGDRQERERSG